MKYKLFENQDLELMLDFIDDDVVYVYVFEGDK